MARKKIHLVFKTHLDIGFTDYAPLTCVNSIMTTSSPWRSGPPSTFGAKTPTGRSSFGQPAPG